MTSVGVAGGPGARQASRVRRRLLEPWSALALVVLVLTSYVPAALALGGGRAVAVSALGLAFVASSLAGAWTFERAHGVAQHVWVFGVPLTCGAVALYLSGGRTMMSLLATLSLAVMLAEGLARAVTIGLVVAAIAMGLGLYASSLAELAQGAAGMGALGAFVGAFSHMVRARDDARAELADAHASLKERSLDLAALAAERERLRIAREIHDSVGHWLTAAHVHLETARALVDADEAGCRAAIDGAQRASREALTEVRTSVQALRAEGGLPLEVQLRRLVGQSPDAALQVAPLGPLPSSVEHALLRVAQEALSNARRHGRASHIDVRLEPTDDGVALTVRDDGVGFDPNADVGGGTGLAHMRERVEDLGGLLFVRTAPGDGVQIRAEVPA